MIRHWMKTNMLALSDSRTEVIHFYTKYCDQGFVPQCDHRVGGVGISPNAVYYFLGSYWIRHEPCRPMLCVILGS